MAQFSPGLPARVLKHVALRFSTVAYQLDEALGALDIELSGDEMKTLEAPYEPHRVLGPV